MAEPAAVLVAPCGINCARCAFYLAYAHRRRGLTRCAGCRPRGKACAHLKGQCALLHEGKVTYCYECPGFPCPRLEHLDKRYRARYQTSPIANLREIQARGMAAFLAWEETQRRCPRCGGLLCMHNGKCYQCEEVRSWRG